MTTRPGRNERGRFLPGNKLGRGNQRIPGQSTRLINFRLTGDEVAELDALTTHYGGSRSAVVRALIAWASKKRPKL